MVVGEPQGRPDPVQSHIATISLAASAIAVEGDNALFVPRHDPAVLAAAIERLLGDSGLRERMCAANRAKVREFAPSVAARRYIDALEEIVRGATAA